MSTRYALASAVLLATLYGPAASAKDREGCSRVAEKGAYCGLPNPEDLEVTPDGRGVIASDMRITRTEKGITASQGVLKLFDPKSGAITPLYPAPNAGAASKAWGDPSCPGEIGAALLPHGVHLSRRSDGRWQLLAVNHGSRESVEFFELTRAKGQWQLAWCGCAVPPGTNRLNDVAGLPQGDFVVTHMGGNGAAAAADPGFLWRWSQRGGFAKLAIPGLNRPNGVQVDRAGRFAYVSSAANGGTLGKVELASGRIVGTVAVPNPDNASWGADGRLLVTGMTPAGRKVDCFVNPTATCGAAFEVYAISPATLKAQRLLAQEGAPMGAGTVAIQFGHDMLIGSFVGDRVMLWRGAFARRKETKP